MGKGFLSRFFGGGDEDNTPAAPAPVEPTPEVEEPAAETPEPTEGDMGAPSEDTTEV